nr:E7 [Equus caballus papillomavirus 10]
MRRIESDQEDSGVESDFEEEQADREPERLAPYRIVLPCACCECLLRMVVQCSSTDINGLNRLLCGSLGILCPTCAVERGYHGR